MNLPDKRLTPQEYMDRRVEDQRVWYEDKSSFYERQRIAFGVAMAFVTALTSLASSADGILLQLEWESAAYAHRWVVAGSALLMSLSVAITSLATLRSPDYLASSYRATARQIRELQLDWSRGKRYAGPGGFERFVVEVEDVMSREHSSWAKHTFETSRANPQQGGPAGGAAPAGAAGGAGAPPLDDDEVGGGNDYRPGDA